MSEEKKNASTKKAPAAKKVAVKKKVVVKKKEVVASTVKKETNGVADNKKQSKKVIKMKVAQDALYATGRRKESTAKVWMFKGSGKVTINHLNPLDYLSSDRLVSQVMLPLKLVNLENAFDIRIDVLGGGLTGQAEAATLGVSRSLLLVSEDFRGILKENGLLTQDSREKERKKYGKRGARKSPQFRKR